MDKQARTCPLSQQELIDQFFIEHRTKILDIAAYLDRMDRSVDQNAENDFRFIALQEAVETLTAHGADRTKKIQMIFSDPTVGPLVTRDRQGAFGAYAGSKEDGS